MNSYTIITKNLSYHFKKDEKILDNLNLTIPAGSIYGFLGRMAREKQLR
ncbi:MAG: hypothetical protein QM802_21140 [Agriterribacter sp.]